MLAPGYPVNQTPGATAVRDGATLILRIPGPVAGSYAIGLHGVGNGSVQVASSSGEVSDAVNLAVGEGQDWSFRLAVDTQALRFGPPVLAANAAAVRPANVPIPDRVIAAASATAVRAEPSDTPKPPTRTPTPTRTVQPALTAVPATPVRTNGTSIDSVAP